MFTQPTAAAHPGGEVRHARQQSCQKKYRERLAALVAGGQAKQYGLVVHGKALTADQIDALDNSEIEKLYARYEARLGAAMTKTLGSAALQILCRCDWAVRTDPGPTRAHSRFGERSVRRARTKLVLPVSSITAMVCG